MILIGICGKARVGKDTAADYLVTKYNLYKYSLATPMRNMLSNIGVEYTEYTKENPHPVFSKSPREMLQTLGTEWMRDTVDKDGWIKLAAKKFEVVKDSWRDQRGMVVPDIRFENEAQWVRENGLLIYIYGRDIPKIAQHSSENGINTSILDTLINNNGSFQELYNQLNLCVDLYNESD